MVGVGAEYFMHMALGEAHKALALGEVPVGAVAVRGQVILGRAYNLRELVGDPTAHAEVLALRQAARRLGTWRLDDVTLYVTLEPCVMCAGAMVQARLGALVYGAPDPKGGGCDSVYDVIHSPWLNHRVAVRAGVLAAECQQVVQEFFRARRDG
ncbi:MAG: nucleoside deaminase [Clostridia bacterium]|nr:MAG: nucleoside deaminase [Clostridia bacterium]